MRPVLLLALALAAPRSLVAQAPDLPKPDSVVVVELRLADGTSVVGRVTGTSDSILVVTTPLGVRLDVPKRAVSSWRRTELVVVRGQLWNRDPNISRLFFAPTARTLPQGDGYFGDYYLFIASVAYGVTDFFTISGGMSLLPGIQISDQLYFVAPKLRLVQQGPFTLSGGVLYMGAGGGSGGASGGVGYGVTTLGSGDHSLTLGLGWPFVVGHGSSSEPMLLIGGDTRLSRRVKLVGEWWKFPGASQMPGTIGLRFFGEKMAVDFGFVHVWGARMGGFPAIPYLDFAIHF